MSPKIKNVIPDGWRPLAKGEMILFGDFFNARTQRPEEDPFWMPYKKFVGAIFNGETFYGIRRERDDAPLPENRLDEDTITVRRDFSSSRNSWPVNEPVYSKVETAKDKVASYLKKFKTK